MKNIVLLLATAWFVTAQTKPTQAEIDQWQKAPGTLESTKCKMVTLLLDSEKNGELLVLKSAELVSQQPWHYALGWWGKGFIEGAIFMIHSEKAEKRASDFGLSVEVVAAHIATYCYDHPNETPLDAVENLLAKVLK
jgi:hypothetical protein